MPELISRGKAKALGFMHYFTGKPCPHGHVCERLVSTWQCMECMRLHAADYRVKNPEKVRASEKAYREANPAKIKKFQKAYREANRDEIIEYERAYKKKNKEKIKIQKAEWRDRNPEKVKVHQERRKQPEKKARRRELYRANPEPDRKRSANYRRENPEKVKAATSAWFKANPIRRRGYNAQRKAREKNAGGKFTPDDVTSLFKAQGKKCAYCRTSLLSVRWHVDHIVPLSRGGTNDKRNIQILCQPCNQRKYAKDPIDFAQSIGLLL